MTDTAAGDSGPVFRLIYRSHSTGALLINDDQFVQTLEGPEPAVRDLYTKISKDRRHEHVELLESGDAAGRVFGRWAMAKMAADGEPDIPLLTNVNKGGISPAQPRPATEAQEAVLGRMRQSLRPAGASAPD